MNDVQNDHPAFVLARALPENVRHYFPHSQAEAQVWSASIYRRALASRVLAVAQTRIECAWSAYCDAVPGQNHADEVGDVLRFGVKLPETIARALFPRFDDIPYAD